MFDVIVKAHGLMGHHIQGLQQNPSYLPLGPNEVRSLLLFLLLFAHSLPIRLHRCAVCALRELERALQEPLTRIAARADIFLRSCTELQPLDPVHQQLAAQR